MIRFRSLLFDAVAQLEKDIKDREAARGQLLVSLQQSLSNKGVTVSIDPTSGILRLPEDLLFKTGDAAIGKENVSQAANACCSIGEHVAVLRSWRRYVGMWQRRRADPRNCLGGRAH